MCRQHSTKEIRTWFSGKLRYYGSGIGGAHIEYHNECAVRAEFYTLPTHLRDPKGSLSDSSPHKLSPRFEFPTLSWLHPGKRHTGSLGVPALAYPRSPQNNKD